MFLTGEQTERVAKSARLLYDALETENKDNPTRSNLQGAIQELERSFAGLRFKLNESLLGKYISPLLECVDKTVIDYDQSMKIAMPAPTFIPSTQVATNPEPVSTSIDSTQLALAITAAKELQAQTPSRSRSSTKCTDSELATTKKGSRRSITPISRVVTPACSRQSTPSLPGPASIVHQKPGDEVTDEDLIELCKLIPGESKAARRARQGRPVKKRRYSVSPQPTDGISETARDRQFSQLRADIENARNRNWTKETGAHTRSVAKVEERNSGAKGRTSRKRKTHSKENEQGEPVEYDIEASQMGAKKKARTEI